VRRVTPEVREYPASPDLAASVHRFLHGVAGQPGELIIPPTGGIFLSYVSGTPLVVHFRDRVYTRKPRLFLGGQLRHERPVMRSSGRFELLGAEFTPSGYYKLFHRKASWLTDSMGDLGEAHPEVASALDRRLGANDEDIASVIAVMEDVLRSLSEAALTAPVVDAMVDDITAAGGVIRLRDLYATHGLPARRARRYFEAVVGISPKHFCKICQVNAVIRAMIVNDSRLLRSLALDHGFYDQAHFIHDFRRFVAMDPGRFLRDGSQFLRTYLGKVAG